MNKQDLDPKNVVLYLVLPYSPTMPRGEGIAIFPGPGSYVLAAKNHRGQPVSLSGKLDADGIPFDGDETSPARFVLRKLGPTVWALAPSVNHPLLHAYVTVVSVPEPAPWETT